MNWMTMIPSSHGVSPLSVKERSQLNWRLFHLLLLIHVRVQRIGLGHLRLRSLLFLGLGVIDKHRIFLTSALPTHLAGSSVRPLLTR